MNNDSSAARVAGSVRAWIASNPSATTLPSTRTLAREHGVGPVTVQHAVQLLVADGVVETKPGAGTFVVRAEPRRTGDVSWQSTALGPSPAVDFPGSGVRSVPDGTTALHTGYPSPALLPGALVRSALQRVAREPDAYLGSSAPAGEPALRSWFARELDRGGPGGLFDADDVVVTSGGQAAISAVLRALTAPGDTIVMESPTYWGAIAAARAQGLRIVPVARSRDGIDPADLDAALTMHDARVFYAQPTYANPTGSVWTADVRAGVRDVLVRRKAFMLEDDWARDLFLGAQPPPPMAAGDVDGHILYVRSLTKSVSPSVRVAALVSRGPVLARIRATRWVGELLVPRLTQRIALDVVSSAGWARGGAGLRRGLRARRDALVSAVRDASHLTVEAVPDGGVGLWVALPKRVDPAELTAVCLDRGVALSPGHEWFPAEQPGPFVRLAFAGESEDRYVEAVQVVEDAVRESM
ncbi:PLP-dependent aminotransferase family protein [Rhodococcus sp. HNM0569]|uniref:aminotransferase-like domain-containing protein n=1 Tax=Rhodococcus sp. HNM0569 TaxID=2716340 RepID=UPI00146D4A66|nr:PLP-dependent aminotransferase family protein [Rhodococcus sp. HNM0569]NLU83570.1 PLP-dependent aminotransferase family protein [Rhodococcus sp. HNM0569]